MSFILSPGSGRPGVNNFGSGHGGNPSIKRFVPKLKSNPTVTVSALEPQTDVTPSQPPVVVATLSDVQINHARDNILTALKNFDPIAAIDNDNNDILHVNNESSSLPRNTAIKAPAAPSPSPIEPISPIDSNSSSSNNNNGIENNHQSENTDDADFEDDFAIHRHRKRIKSTPRLVPILKPTP